MSMTLSEAIQMSSLCNDDKGKLMRLQRLTARKSIELSGEELAEVRVAAGLSLLQTAVLLHINPLGISALEREIVRASPEFYARLDQVYGIGGKL